METLMNNLHRRHLCSSQVSPTTYNRCSPVDCYLHFTASWATRQVAPASTLEMPHRHAGPPIHTVGMQVNT